MDKFDVTNAVRKKLKRDAKLLEQFEWLLKVWNTDDDRGFEDFDPAKPYGANYVPEDDDDGNAEFTCSNCGHTNLELEFWPSDGNPEPHACPKCGSTQCGPKTGE